MEGQSLSTNPLLKLLGNRARPLTQLNADRKKGRVVLGCNKGRTYYENKHYLNKRKAISHCWHWKEAVKEILYHEAQSRQSVQIQD